MCEVVVKKDPHTQTLDMSTLKGIECVLDQMLRENLIPFHAPRRILFGQDLSPSVYMCAHVCAQNLFWTLLCVWVC